MNLALLKVGIIIGVLVVTLISALAPLKLDTSSKGVQSFLTNFGYITGGIFLGAGVLHMLPDSVELYNTTMPGGSAGYPIIYLMACIGFILIFGVEQAGTDHHTLAVATKSSVENSQANICYVHVEPVTSYTPKDTGLRRRNKNKKVTNVPLLPTDSFDENYGSQDHSHGHGHGHDHAHGVGSGGSSISNSSCSSSSSNRPPFHPDNSQQEDRHDCCGHDHSHRYNSPPHDHGNGHDHGHGHGQHARPAVPEPVPMPASVRSHTAPVSAELGGLVESESVTPHRRKQRSNSWADSMSFKRSALVTSDGAADVMGHHGRFVHGPGPGQSNGGAHAHVSSSRDAGDAHGDDACAGHAHDHAHENVMHSHVSLGGSLLPYVLAVAFSVHSFIAGLSLGLQKTASTIMAVFIAIFAHKVVEAVAVGTNFAREGVPMRKAVPVLLTYSVMTPLGISAGMAIIYLLNGMGKLALQIQAILQGLAAGSFIYLTFHQLQNRDEHEFQRQKRSHFPVIRQVLLVLLGLLSMALLAIWL